MGPRRDCGYKPLIEFLRVLKSGRIRIGEGPLIGHNERFAKERCHTGRSLQQGRLGRPIAPTLLSARGNGGFTGGEARKATNEGPIWGGHFCWLVLIGGCDLSTGYRKIIKTGVRIVIGARQQAKKTKSEKN